MTMAELVLHPGKERSVMRRHPWIFEGAVDHLEGPRARRRHGGPWSRPTTAARSARAAFSPHSQIRARMWSFDAEETIDHAFFKRRVAAAVGARAALPELRGQQGAAPDPRRVGRPAGRDRRPLRRDGGAAAEQRRRGQVARGHRRRAGAGDRLRAGLRAFRLRRARAGRSGSRAPARCSAAERDGLVIGEHGVSAGGRHPRRPQDRLLPRPAREPPAGARQLAGGRSVLNCFCYTGGFSLQALAGGAASVLSIDSSGPALASARRNLALNPQLDAERAEWRDADVFEELRALKKAGARFDLIVLDPPKFAPSAAHADRAARAYKDINLLGFRLLNPGGMLMTYSCSGGIGLELFQKIVAGAASDAGADARILRRLSARRTIRWRWPSRKAST
jgi:23S rRNA (cytosine1962-C5)-methyltransferase